LGGDEVLRERCFLGFEGADLGLETGDEGVELALFATSLLEAFGEAIEEEEMSEEKRASAKKGLTH
jgi:hypothetical protein